MDAPTRGVLRPSPSREYFLVCALLRRTLPGAQVVWHQPTFSTSNLLPWLRRLGIPRSPPIRIVPADWGARGAVRSARMEEDEDAGRLRRRTTTTKRWEHSGGDRQVLRRTTTTHRVYSKTTVLEEFGPLAEQPHSSAIERRHVGYETAVETSTQPIAAAEAQSSYGRRGISDEELEDQAVQLRAYWAKRIGKPHPRFEARLKPMCLEFRLEKMREFIDRVAEEVPEDAEMREAVELLFSLMRQARYQAKSKEGKT